MTYTKKGIVILFYFLSLTVSSRPVINLQKSADGYLFEYKVPQLQMDDVNTLGQSRAQGSEEEAYARISIPGFKTSDDIGKAELPLLVFYMALSAPDQVPEFEVTQKIDEKISLNNRVYPAQIPWPKSRPLSERPFSCDEEYYHSIGEKGSLARVDEIFTIRGVPCVRIEIAPFSYNPLESTVTVTRKFTLKIRTSTAVKFNGLSSKAFEKYLRYALVNFDDAVEPVTVGNRSDDYLIITAPSYESDLDEFVSFRRNRFNVTMITTGTTGNSTTQIEGYIRALDPLPTYILLVGETGDIPQRTGTATDNPLTDLYYSCMDESDYYPDIFLGRFSVSNSTQLDNILYKTMFMELNLAAIDKIGVFTGGTDAGSGHIAEATHDYITSTHFIPDDYACKKLYTNSGQGSESEYTQYINSGVIWNIYSGHGTPTSWAVGGNFGSITTADVEELTNTTSFPFSYAFACETGTLQQSECISEAWVRSGKNGAVTHIGSSVTSFWSNDDELERGIVDAVYATGIPVTSIAGSMNAGKLAVGSVRQRYHEMYNLVGDPALEVFPVEIDPFITVKVPNGGEEFERVTTRTVTWNDNIDGSVRIEVVKGTAVVTVLANSTESDGVYEWQIPGDFQTGMDYRIRITSVDSANLYDDSDTNFSIIEEYIIIDYPYVQDFDDLDSGENAPLPDKWEQLDDDDIDWIVFAGPTPSNVGSSPGATGPSADHTTGTGNYIYIEASEKNNPEKKADCISSKFNFRSLSKPQMIFWYHMLSDSNTMGELFLDIDVDGIWMTGVVHLADDKGDAWRAQTVDLSHYKGDRVRFRFRGITGQSWASDIAVDDVIITSSPEFTSDPVLVGAVNEPYSYTATASDEDDNGSGLSFVSTTLPSWLSITNNGDGSATLYGTPDADDGGDNAVVVTVSDGFIPEPIKQSFTLCVPILLPVIIADPKSVTVTETETASFSVAVSGSALGLQWQKDGGNIPNATGFHYTTPPVKLGDNKCHYRCVVVNSAGSVTSGAAQLTVVPFTAILDKDNGEVTGKGLSIVPNPAGRYHNEIQFRCDVIGVLDAQLTIYDALGNRIWDAGFSGLKKWDLCNDRGRRVSAGMYCAVLWLMYKEDNSIRQVTRIFGIEEE